MNIIQTNPFLEPFNTHYEKLMAHSDSSFFGDCITGLLAIDEDDIVNIMTNELGNTVSVYTTKLKNEFIQAITLKIDAPQSSHFIPSVVLASAYDSFNIENSSTIPLNKLLPELSVPLYKQVKFGKCIFQEFGGCDVDMVSDFLYDVVSCHTEMEEELFIKIQSLAIIKILELLYNACHLLIQGKRFNQLPKKIPFGFFAYLDNRECISIITYNG